MPPPHLSGRSGDKEAVGFPYRHWHRHLRWTGSRAGYALQMAFALLALPFHFIRSSKSVVKNAAPPRDSLRCCWLFEAREGQRLLQPHQDEMHNCRCSDGTCVNVRYCNYCTKPCKFLALNGGMCKIMNCLSPLQLLRVWCCLIMFKKYCKKLHFWVICVNNNV